MRDFYGLLIFNFSAIGDTGFKKLLRKKKRGIFFEKMRDFYGLAGPKSSACCDIGNLFFAVFEKSANFAGFLRVFAGPVLDGLWKT